MTYLNQDYTLHLQHNYKYKEDCELCEEDRHLEMVEAYQQEFSANTRSIESKKIIVEELI